jgi:hypothetical protein
VCLGCGRCWQWEGTSWRSADLPEGYPPTGGAPTLADLPTQPDQPDADFVVTEVWIDQWASDAPPAYPTVDDLETGEAISVADCPHFRHKKPFVLTAVTANTPSRQAYSHLFAPPVGHRCSGLMTRLLPTPTHSLSL